MYTTLIGVVPWSLMILFLIQILRKKAPLEPELFRLRDSYKQVTPNGVE